MGNKLLPALVKKIEYSKKVKVADIKKYLADEYKLTDKLNKENKELRKQLDEADITRQKYELTLITLDEYTKRLKEKDKTIDELLKDKDNLKKEKQKIFDENNDLKIRYRDFEKEIKETETIIFKSTKQMIIERIQETKGQLSKTKVIDIIKKLGG